jgi:hypothetical protein
MEILHGGSWYQRTGHDHGTGELRKKKPLFHFFPDLGPLMPVKSAPTPCLHRKKYQPFLLREKKCRNTASDGGTSVVWQSTTKPTKTRQPLGVSWPGATPKWESTSEKKG